jgi:hypothetical protein
VRIIIILMKKNGIKFMQKLNKINLILLKYGGVKFHPTYGGRFYQTERDVSEEDKEELFSLGINYHFDSESFFVSDEDLKELIL